MASNEGHTKKQKLDLQTCIICGVESSGNELSKLRDEQSWNTLCTAAAVRQFEPILKLKRENTTETPCLYYHRNCRAEFTHQKTLKRLSKQEESADDPEEGSSDPRHSMRKSSSTSQSRLYDKKCIFCMKITKYIKGTNTREPLKAAVELRADKTVRDIAIQRMDQRIISLTSRDIVAAEAQFHRTCYRDYTRQRTDIPHSDKEEDPYQQAEHTALNMLFCRIRDDIFSYPRIVPLTELTSQVISFMQTKGIDQIRDGTKTHLRRNLEMEFGDSLHFFTVGHRVYVRPDNLTPECIFAEYVKLKTKLEAFDEQQTYESMIQRVAVHLRDKIKKERPQQSWPPHPDELNMAYFSAPDCLMQFLNTLLGGQQDPSVRISRLTWSISQDIVSAVTLGEVLTPKHILLPWVIKTLTGNVELVKTINRLGHGCSYSSFEEIDTALCMEKLNNVDGDTVPLPMSIHPSVPTVLAFDNIDRQEEVLSGSGTSHRVNGIIVQPKSSSCAPSSSCIPVDKKERKRTINPLQVQIPIYIVGKRNSPPPIVPHNLTAAHTASMLNAQRHNILWTLARMHDSADQTVSSWTGFNILTRDHKEVTEDTIGYLPTINSPATDMSTVQEILQQSVSIQSSLHLENIAVVFDQALYAKATEIAWRYPERFGHIVLMMGNFHTICNVLSTIGKMFGDAGLRDLAVESGVIAEGSINKVLEGKQYNRAVRLHKLTYEALMRLAWAGFEDWLEVNHAEDLPKLNDTIQVVYNLRQNICHATHEAAWTDESCKRVLDLFTTYLNILRNTRGPLASFWMMYVDIVEIVLGLLRADREGDWNLHLACIRNLIPWCFAMDKTNYSRYLPVYYAQMSRLQETSQHLYDHFQNGGFSVQLRKGNPFGRIAVDQTTEETVNKDTQTAGGTRGFSLKPGTVSRYYLTAEYRAAALRQLRQQISTQRPDSISHVDLEKARIKRDETDVASLVDLLENNWTNPFAKDPSDLVSLSTGVATPQNITTDLLTARQKGEEAYKSFQEQRLQKGENFHDPIKKLKLKTFSETTHKTVKRPTKEIILKADRRLFGNMILIAQNRKLEMRDVLSHPLGTMPWALANVDGTMKKTNKAVLSKYLESKVLPAEEVPHPCATLIDAMALIQKVHGENLTFTELSNHVFAQILHAGHGSDRIDVVFDVYQDDSIKSAERVNRGSEDGVTFHRIIPGHKIKNWRRLLACTESKNKLNAFLAESWKEQTTRDMLREKSMFVTCGDLCLKLTQAGWQEMDDLQSKQEEADTRLLLHAKHAAGQYPNLVCITEDTDVLIIFLGLAADINCNIFIRRGTKASVRLVDISKLSAALGRDICTAMIGLHPWTGCDTVSALAGQGKLKAFKLLSREQRFTEVFASLGSSWNIPNEMFDTIQEFTCQLYSRNTKVNRVNELRYQMFRSRKGDIESGQLPPCEDSLLQHTRRANYQAGIWRRSLVNSPDIPNPTEHGWTTNADGNYVIQWMTCAPAPEVVLSLMSCKCARSCRSADCTCMLNGLKCTQACKLVTCSNMADEQEDPTVDVQDSSDSDDD